MSHGSQSAGGLVVDDLESSMTGEIIQIGNGILYRVRGKRPSTLVMRASNSLTFKAGAKVCCHYWSSGKRIAVPAVDLIPLHAEQQPSLAAAYERMARCADGGSSDAMWWLGWWHEGTEHSRSTWYYIAALRRNPKTHGWALGRIISDTLFGCMGMGEPVPSTSFTRDIPEFKSGRIGTDWQQAVAYAKSAVETAVTAEQVDAMFALLLEGVSDMTAGWRTGVPTNGLSRHPQWAAFVMERDRKRAEEQARSTARHCRFSEVANEGSKSPLGSLCPHPPGSEDAHSWHKGRDSPGETEAPPF